MGVKRARPVRQLILLSNLVVSLSTTLLMLGASVGLFLGNSVRNLQTYSEYMAQSLASAAIDPLLTEAYISLEGTVETFRGRPDITGAYVANRSGVIVSALDTTKLGMRVCDACPVTEPLGESACAGLKMVNAIVKSEFKWRWPVEYGGSYLGCATVVISLSGIHERIRSIIVFGLASGVVVFAVAVSLGMVLAVQVSRPIEDLTGLAAMIADGNAPGLMPRSLVKEVSALSGSMFDMAFRLEARQLAIEQARDSATAARDELQASAECLSTALDEKTVLLREVHHRTKNNLQVIMSLFYLEQAKMRDPEDAAVLEQGQSRIRSMALVHEMLYKSENMADIDMRDYFETLCVDSRMAAMCAPRVSLDLYVERISLSIDEAVPLGLLANELVTNALKHAFKGRSDGTIHLSLTSSGDTISFSVSDDGVGTPLGRPPEPSLGLTLVAALADQLGARVEWRWDGGTGASLSFVRRRFYPTLGNGDIMAASG